MIPTKGAIIPAAVGVDIGCGMNALRTALTAEDLPENPAELRQAIETAVPHGRTTGRCKRDKGAGKIHLLTSMLNGLSLKPVISG